MTVDQAGQQRVARQIHHGRAFGRGIVGSGDLGDAAAVDDNGAIGQQFPGHHVEQRPRADDHALRSRHAAV
jgi:hypothetical protein